MNIFSVFTILKRSDFTFKTLKFIKKSYSIFVLFCFSVLVSQHAYSSLNQCTGGVLGGYKGLESRGVVTIDSDSQSASVSVNANSGPFINKYERKFDANLGFYFEEVFDNSAGAGANQRMPNVNGGWVDTGIVLNPLTASGAPPPASANVAMKVKGEVSLAPWSHLSIELDNDHIRSDKWINLTESVTLPEVFRFYVTSNDTDAIFSDGDAKHLGGRNAYIQLGTSEPQNELDSDYEFDDTKDQNFKETKTFELKDKFTETNKSEFYYKYNYNSIVLDKLYEEAESADASGGAADPNIAIDDIRQNEYQEIWSSGAANNFYIWFDDTEGNYANNEVLSPGGKFKIDIYYQDFKNYGENGQFLEYLITEDTPDHTTQPTGEFNSRIIEYDNIVSTSADPVWSEGKDLEVLAPQNGYTFIDGATFTGQTGSLWLRIKDDPNETWSYHLQNLGGSQFGDGLYSNDESFSTIYKNVYTSAGNYGTYEIEIVADGFALPNNQNEFLVDAIINVKNEIFGQVGADGLRDGGKVAVLFRAVINAESQGGVRIFANIVRALLSLYIVFMGYSFIIGFQGFSKNTSKEMMTSLFKIILLFALIAPTSWDFFYNYLFAIFIEGIDSLIGIVSGHFSSSQDFNNFFFPTGDPAADVDLTNEIIAQITPNSTIDDPVINTFDFFYTTLRVMFAYDSMAIKWVALAFSSLSGFIMAIILLVSVAFFCWLVFKAFLVYMLAMVIIGLLLFLAPIFIPMILFKKTYPLFENWIKLLISYTAQPVFLFAVLAIFNAIYLGLFFHIMNFNACNSCILFVDLPFSELITGGTNFLFGNFDALCWIHGYTPWGYKNYFIGGLLVQPSIVEVSTMITLILLLYVMSSFIGWAVQIAESLSAGRDSAGSLYEAAGETMYQAGGAARNLVNTPVNMYATLRPSQAKKIKRIKTKVSATTPYVKGITKL